MSAAHLSDPSPTHASSDDTTATASHPPSSAPDPTTSQPYSILHHPPPPSGTATHNATQGGLGLATTPSSSPAELARLKVKIQNGLRQFLDFPSPGILFEDIMPIFASPDLHNSLITALELQMASVFHTSPGVKSEIDVIVGLESRGFLFGPTLAQRLGAGFVPVRKQGKLPGPCATEAYQKEYGEDFFQMQSDAIQPGQRVVIVDDIIATGKLEFPDRRVLRRTC